MSEATVINIFFYLWLIGVGVGLISFLMMLRMIVVINAKLPPEESKPFYYWGGKNGKLLRDGYQRLYPEGKLARRMKFANMMSGVICGIALVVLGIGFIQRYVEHLRR